MNTLSPGATLQNGKYRIEHVLGQGGFGITYLAEQPMLGRKVAVKEFFMKQLCNRDDSTSHVSVPSVGSKEVVQRFREKFLKEARLIACMNNHHIVPIYDIFEENGTAYYVMEHIDGGSLDGLVKKAVLSEQDAMKYVYEIADALDYIHKQNVLHLDVKPSNVLIRHNGEAVLIDFGISKRYDDAGSQTSSTPAGISKGYAPVEQYNQGLTNFSPATDIYSLGATFYKMLTGVTPPEASLLLDEDEELVRPEGISFSTWVAIEKAMEPRRKKRPQSVKEFLALLKQDVEILTPSIIEEEPPEETIILEENIDVLQELKSENGKTFCVKGVKFNMIKVEAGNFTMGRISDDLIDVRLSSSFYMGETTVTQELWTAVMENNPSMHKGELFPVECVSWNMCKTFIQKLNAITHQEFRLPTEAEWEFAARGGNMSQNNYYSGSNDVNSVSWYKNNAAKSTHFVKTKSPNELGIFDMSGNVWEWCEDYYAPFFIRHQVNPHGPETGYHKVYRGGSYLSPQEKCLVSTRNHDEPNSCSSDLGFRLALNS